MDIARHCMNLLYITAGETSHYVLLKDLSRLILQQNNNQNDKNISDNIVYMTKQVKRYWKKNSWKDASHRGHKESSSQKLTTRRSATKSSLQRHDTNYVYLLSDMQISKVFYVNKTLCGPSSSKSFITQYQHHIPCWSCICMKCSDRQYFEAPQVI